MYIYHSLYCYIINTSCLHLAYTTGCRYGRFEAGTLWLVYRLGPLVSENAISVKLFFVQLISMERAWSTTGNNSILSP